MDYYAILGVHPTAEDIVIRAAYKALAQRYHPDRFAGSKDEAHRRMSDLTKAYEVLADPVRRPKYDRRRSTYAHSVAASFSSSTRYASPALDPGDLRSAAAKRRRSRVALSALMTAVVVLSAFNIFHYSTRLKDWLGASTPKAVTPEFANTGRASVVDAAGAASDDSPPTASTGRTRNLPIGQISAKAAPTAAPKAEPSTSQGPAPVSANEKVAAKRSGSIAVRPPVAAIGRPAPASGSPADTPLANEKTRADARNASVDRPPKSPSTAVASDPCRDAVAALGLCSPNITAKNK